MWKSDKKLSILYRAAQEVKGVKKDEEGEEEEVKEIKKDEKREKEEKEGEEEEEKEGRGKKRKKGEDLTIYVELLVRDRGGEPFDLYQYAKEYKNIASGLKQGPSNITSDIVGKHFIVFTINTKHPKIIDYINDRLNYTQYELSYGDIRGIYQIVVPEHGLFTRWFIVPSSPYIGAVYNRFKANLSRFLYYQENNFIKITIDTDGNVTHPEQHNPEIISYEKSLDEFLKRQS